MSTRFETYENYARHSENLAKTLDKSSATHAALERAGWALAFTTMHHGQANPLRHFKQFHRLPGHKGFAGNWGRHDKGGLS
jgi:hypothetical protein